MSVVSCPSCSSKLNVSDSSVGKRVKCPKCGGAIAVPVADDFEVVDDDPPAKPARSARPVAAAKPVAKRPARDEDDEDEEDDRPRKSRRRDDDDDDDDRPRKKKVAAKKGGPPILLIAVGGGIALLAVLGTVAYFVFGGKATGPGGVLGPATPPGYTAVNDAEGGYQVFLPGTAVKGTVDIGEQNRARGVEKSIYGGADGKMMVRSESVKPPTGTVPGSSPEQLMSYLPNVTAKWYTVVAKEDITLDGKPALLLKVKDNKNWMDAGKDAFDDPTPPAFLQGEQLKQWQENQAEFKKTRDKINKDIERDLAAQPVKHHVYLVTTDQKRVFVIHLEAENEFPAEEKVKTIRDSFRFR